MDRKIIPPVQTDNRPKEREAILQTIADAFWIIDKKGIILDVNESLCRMSRYSRGELIGKSIGDLDAVETPEDTEKRIKRIIINGSEIFETEHIRKDGTVFPIEVSSSHISEYGGRFICLGRDLTKKKEYEDKLAFSEERYRLLSEVTTEGILIHWNGVAKDVNARLCKMLGYKKAELINKDLMFLVPDKYRKTVNENIKKEVCQPYTIEMIKKGGEYFYAEIESRNIKTAKGTVRTTVIRDVSERENYINALKKSEENFRSLIENLPYEIYIHDLDGNIIFANQIAAINTGFSMEELASMIVYDLDPEADSRSDKTEFWEKIDINEVHSFKSNHLRKDGSVYPVEIIISKMISNNEAVIIAVIIDITERNEQERENIKLQEQLVQAQKLESVGRLAGGVAHDFNNMLSIIIGNSDMAKRKLDKSDPLLERIEKISHAAERSADLTRQLLAFARKQTVKPEIIDINKSIESMLKMIRRLVGEDISIKWNPGEALEKVSIDPAQIDQLIMNLVINARDAIENKRGNIIIETENIYLDEQYCKNHSDFSIGKYIRIEISDDGCGMEKEVIKNIFEPFFTSKEKDKGTGLGLSTVYGIVKQNRGFINVYSEPGLGSSFKIYFPVSRNKNISKETVKADTEGRQGHETVLIVEDEAGILDMVRESLEDFGYNVISAYTPAEALNLAGKYSGTIDVLLTDVIMPEMNGRELAKSLITQYPDIKRIFMSGYTADIIARQGILDDDVNYIQKPFSISDLNTKIREILDN